MIERRPGLDEGMDVLRRLRDWLWPGSKRIATIAPASRGSAAVRGERLQRPEPGERAAQPRERVVEDGSASTGSSDPVASDPFAPFASALGIETPPEPAPLSPEDEAEDGRVAALVRERFAASRPEPSSFPAVALQILNLAARPEAEVEEMARLVARDPALSAGVLSVANSPVHRGLMEVETTREAVARLGLDELGRVAAAVSARTLFSPRHRAEQAAFGARFTDLFGHAVAVGSAAASVALGRPGARADRVYLGGLLHDVGKALALSALASLVVDGKLSALAPERVERVLDQLHVELGGEAHQIWALPQYLTVLAVRHHDPEIPADEEFRDLHVVRLAGAVYDLRAEPELAWRASREILQSAGALHLDANGVRALAAELRQAEEKVSTTFGLDGAAPPGRRG